MPTATRDRRGRLVFLRDLARIGVPRAVRDHTDWSNPRSARLALLPYVPADGDPLDWQDLRYALTASGVRHVDAVTAAGGRPWNVGDKSSRGRWRRKDGADGGGARPWSNHPNLPEAWKDRSALDVLLHGQKDPRAKRAKGGHLYGAGMPNKTQFPQSWTAADVEEAYAATRLDPDWRRVRNSGDVMLLREVNGVRVSLAYHPNPDGTERVVHGHPESGPGVTRTDATGTPTTTIDTHSPVNVNYTWARADRSEPPR